MKKFLVILLISALLAGLIPRPHVIKECGWNMFAKDPTKVVCVEKVHYHPGLWLQIAGKAER